MKAVNVQSEHPEELLDRARHARVDAGEWISLRQHLSTCDVCAAHFYLTSLPDKTPRPSAARSNIRATDREHHLNRIAAERALERLAPERIDVRPRRQRTLRPRRVQVGIIALLLTGTTAAAAWWAAVRHDPNPGAQAPASTTVNQLAGRHDKRAALVAPQGDKPELEEALALPLPAVATQAPLGRARRDSHPTVASAAQLLQQARRLRLKGDSAGARSTYLKLQESHPRSPESHISHLLLGRLDLETNHLEQAARDFSRYLAGGGSASEEALVGRATALGRLGRTKDEAITWRALLADHPRSVHARRALARLAVLEPQPH